MMGEQQVEATVGRTSGDVTMSLMSFQASMAAEFKKYGNEILNQVSYDKGYQKGYSDAWYKASERLRQETSTFHRTLQQQVTHLTQMMWVAIGLAFLGGLKLFHIL